MPVVFSKDFHKDLDLDGSLKAKAWDFVRKLSSDADLTGLDLKQPQGAVDKRVRTARVDRKFRAVLFDLSVPEESFYLLVAIKPHDDAYALASTVQVRVNPVNGIAEVLRHQDVARAVAEPAKRPATAPVDYRPLMIPYPIDTLTSLGILPEVATAVVELRDEDELQELCLALPDWQADVLLQLAYGTDVEAVRSQYGPTGGPLAEEDFGAAFQHPASRMQFVVVTEDDDELRAMMEGDFRYWRTFLHPEQRAVAYRDRWNGSFRLSGGAGTGKTVVAVHRASFLARARHRPRVLLTTFTRTLAMNLEEDLAQLAGPGVVARGAGTAEPGTVRVAGVDSVARSMVAQVDGHVPKVMSTAEENRLWDTVVQGLPDLTGADIELLGSGFLAAEYRNVILAQEITDRQQYLKAPRRGRGVRLNWLQRSRVWDVVEAFRRRMHSDGRTTFTDLVARAAQLLADPAHRARVGTFDHVIVDEGQDLHATHWLMLRRLVSEGPNDLFICEDSHQRIYGERLTLGQFGIKIVGRSRRLTLNYRTTRQNLRFALRLLKDEPVVDLDGEQDTVAGYRSRLSGAEPELHGFATTNDETRFISDTLRDWLAEPAGPSTDSVGVLVRTNRDRDELARDLRQAGLPVDTLSADSELTGTGIRVATMHRAKGMEFARVIVAGVSHSSIPDLSAVHSAPEADRGDVEQRERLLLYVACTRARDQLVITWPGPPSRFLPVT
jgi:superfamily I DNA/RNA helicase